MLTQQSSNLRKKLKLKEESTSDSPRVFVVFRAPFFGNTASKKDPLTCLGNEPRWFNRWGQHVYIVTAAMASKFTDEDWAFFFNPTPDTDTAMPTGRVRPTCRSCLQQRCVDHLGMVFDVDGAQKAEEICQQICSSTTPEHARIPLGTLWRSGCACSKCTCIATAEKHWSFKEVTHSNVRATVLFCGTMHDFRATLGVRFTTGV